MSTTVNGAAQQTPFGREDRAFDGKRVINYWKDGHVAFVEMDDPPANTYTHEMMRQLDDAILDARFDTDVEVIVLTGKGEKFFSAGANIGMLNAVTPEFKYMFCLHANETLQRLEQTPKLVIAALNGHCVGGGWRSRWRPTCASRARMPARSGFPKSRSAFCPAPAERSGWRASSANRARSS